MSSQRIALSSCVLAGVLTLSACSSTPSVRSDADSRANMANYHTYVWEQAADDVTAGGPAFKNPLNLKRLRAAVDANLARQGLQPVADSTAADAYVTVSIGTRQTIETDNTMPVRLGVGWGYWHPGLMSSVMWDTNNVYSVREGRITVDLFDAKKREAIWHASVEQDMTYLTGDKAEARINAIVDAMFAKFPGAKAPSK